MKKLRVFNEAPGYFGQRSGAAEETDVGVVGLCPAAICSRCGYDFLPYTVSTVCPRCLEPFTRDPCYAGCSSCPLLPA